MAGRVQPAAESSWDAPHLLFSWSDHETYVVIHADITPYEPLLDSLTASTSDLPAISSASGVTSLSDQSLLKAIVAPDSTVVCFQSVANALANVSVAAQVSIGANSLNGMLSILWKRKKHESSYFVIETRSDQDSVLFNSNSRNSKEGLLLTRATAGTSKALAMHSQPLTAQLGWPALRTRKMKLSSGRRWRKP